MTSVLGGRASDPDGVLTYVFYNMGRVRTNDNLNHNVERFCTNLRTEKPMIVITVDSINRSSMILSGIMLLHFTADPYTKLDNRQIYQIIFTADPSTAMPLKQFFPVLETPVTPLRSARLALVVSCHWRPAFQFSRFDWQIS